MEVSFFVFVDVELTSLRLRRCRRCVVKSFLTVVCSYSTVVMLYLEYSTAQYRTVQGCLDYESVERPCFHVYSYLGKGLNFDTETYRPRRSQFSFQIRHDAHAVR